MSDLLFWLMWALVGAALLGALYMIDKRGCEAGWESSGLNARFDMFAGCMIQRKDGTWMPAKNYREVAP